MFLCVCVFVFNLLETTLKNHTTVWGTMAAKEQWERMFISCALTADCDWPRPQTV